MRVTLRITLGIAAAVAIAVVDLTAAWSAWGRELWAPMAMGSAEECPEGTEDIGTRQDPSLMPATALTTEQARRAAEVYTRTLDYADLEIAAVVEFKQSFYVRMHERGTGMRAMELLVDKATGSVDPEMGPNMIWNARYAVHRRSATMVGEGYTVSEGRAVEIAQRWLDANRPGVSVAGRGRSLLWLLYDPYRQVQQDRGIAQRPRDDGAGVVSYLARSGLPAGARVEKSQLAHSDLASSADSEPRGCAFAMETGG